MNTLSKMGLLLIIPCITLSVSAREVLNAQIIKPDLIDRCGKFSPVNGERYKWVQKNINVTSLFVAHATTAGFNNPFSAPASFVAQESNLFCSHLVDPTGFPHHISKARVCQLSVFYGAKSTKTLIPPQSHATLLYSGCYLPSSQRVRSRPISVMAAPVAIKIP